MSKSVQELSLARDIDHDIRTALKDRLDHRMAFLKAVETADSRTASDLKALWESLLGTTTLLRKSVRLGIPVPNAFSIKVQRKLASTVPPRPVIEVSQDAAFQHLEQMCKDAAVAVDVLQYHDSQSLLVCIAYEVMTASKLISTADIRSSVSVTQTTTFSIYTNTPSALFVCRHDRAGQDVHKTDTG